MSKLIRSKDRKVTNSVTPKGNVRIANTFGLPAGKEYSCPGATQFCESICYAGKLEKVYKGVKRILMHNFDLLKNASFSEMYYLLHDMISEFDAECDKKNADKLFRIHWDGDFFSEEYTRAWGAVIYAFPEIKFWVYTRVAESAAILKGQNNDNLSLYFSADPDNIETANFLKSEFDIKIAYVDSDFAKGKDAFPKATKCPENNKALPLISEKGSACAVCGLCVFERKDVLFSTSKK